jgi:hypothetical protein
VKNSMLTARRSAVLAAAACAALAVAGPAQAAPKGLTSFGPGAVTISGDSATIVNDAGEYGGVYVDSRAANGRNIDAVHISFVNTGAVSGGAPRFSVPIDTDRDGDVDLYAFLDVNGCGGDNLVSTDNPDCLVYLNNESAPYENWDALVAAHPTWKLAKGAATFVIADVEGSYSVTDIDLR